MSNAVAEPTQTPPDSKKKKNVEVTVEVRTISYEGIMSAEDVELASSYSRTTIWREERAGRFPRRVQLSPGRVGWIGSEILDWIKSRPKVGSESGGAS